MIKLYTIGFTKKAAETFFTLLGDNGVRKILDIRISPQSQLSGYAEASDLKFFAGRLGLGCEHNVDFAPTKALQAAVIKVLDAVAASTSPSGAIAGCLRSTSARHAPRSRSPI